MSRIPQPAEGTVYTRNDEARIIWCRNVEDFATDTVQFFELGGLDDVLTNRLRLQDLLSTLIIEKPVPSKGMMDDSMARLERYMKKFKETIDSLEKVAQDLDKYAQLKADATAWVDSKALPFLQKLRDEPRPDITEAPAVPNVVNV